MAKYRYVGGNEAEIWDTPYKFNKWSQLVEISDELVSLAHAGRIHIIPADKFDEIGFTSDELKRYTRFESHNAAPADFIEKRNRSWVAAQSYHSKPETGTAPPPIAEPSPALSPAPVVSSLETESVT